MKNVLRDKKEKSKILRRNVINIHVYVFANIKF